MRLREHDGDPPSGSDLGYAHSVLIRNLPPGQIYRFTVRGYNSVGETVWQTPLVAAAGDDSLRDDAYEENDEQSEAYDPGFMWADRWLSGIEGEGKQDDDD